MLNLDRLPYNMSGTPFAGVHRPDFLVEEIGRVPTYVDFSLSHWWPGLKGPAGNTARTACAASPTAGLRAPPLPASSALAAGLYSRVSVGPAPDGDPRWMSGHSGVADPTSCHHPVLVLRSQLLATYKNLSLAV